MPPSSDDPRLGDLLGAALAEGAAPRCVIAGFACDEGGRRNGGRPGAADGPPAIRTALARLTPDAAPGSLDSTLIDDLRERVNGLERDVPVVPQHIYDRVETKYRSFRFVDKALALAPKGDGNA